MKRNLLTVISFTMLSIFVSAQITIDQWDVAMVNTVIRQANDTNPTIGPGAAGANATWNLAAMNNHTQDTLLFTNPNWTPYGTTFPTANLAVEFGMASGNYAYLKNQANGLYVVGQAGDFGFGPMALVMNPNDQMVSFPCTYNTAFNATSRFAIDIAYSQQPPLDSIRVRHQNVKTSICDGWGNVTTPLGMFPALRLKEHNVTIDSIFGHIPFSGWQFIQEQVDSTAHFAWWADGIGFPLVEMDSALDGSGTISNVVWLMATPSPGGFAEFSSKDISIYPNPANSEINFDLTGTGATKVEVMDALGNIVSTFAVTSDIEKADVSGLTNGIYFFNVVGQNGSAIGKGKFSVAK